MLTPVLKKTAILFWIVVLIELAGTSLSIQWIHWLVKPLLMPALLLLFLQTPTQVRRKKLIIAALSFSWLGDIFLLFEAFHPIFFIVGLASFLLAHTCYIGYFLAPRTASISLVKNQPFIFVLVFAYGAGLFLFLFPHLSSLKIPVLIYAVVICSMLLSSIHIYSKINHPANKLYLAGALSFVLSDSLLAINKFYMPLFLAHTWIMLSYCMAQYFIISGCLKERSVAV